MLMLRYRVVILVANEVEQTQMKAVAPDAFRTVVNGRTVWQAGAFGDRTKATELLQALSEKGVQAVIEEL
jgi:hypothetical protein